MSFLKTIIPLVILSTLLGLFGCGGTQPMYTGTFNGKPYELLETETKGFSTNSISYEVKLARWKSVKIDALTTDWGPPYADDLYGKARRVYLSTNPTPYRNEPDNAVQHRSTMLYVSPARFSPDAFAEYADFMKVEWPKIDRQFTSDDYSRFPHVMGLVYGEQGDFVRMFKGKKEGRTYLIRVEPDGRIRYMADGQGANDEYSGLSEKVQMPGKVIFIATGKDAGLTPAQVRTYTDKAGKTLADYFDLRSKK